MIHLESQRIQGTGYSFSYISYKTGYRLINVIVNYNTSKINKYPMKQTACHIFSAFKDTGTYIPCYGDKDGYIVNQGGTGKYAIVMGGEYITT